MHIKKCLVEWISTESIRTYYQDETGKFNIMKPHGRDVFVFKELPNSYVSYWKDWIGRTGYDAGDEIDLCLVSPKEIDSEGLLTAAKETGVKLSLVTQWTIREALCCIQEKGEYDANDGSLSVLVKLDNDRNVCLKNGSKKPFWQDHDFKFVDNNFSNEDICFKSNNVDNSSMNQSQIENQQDDSQSDLATVKEIREAMQRKSSMQCRSIDRRR